MTSSLVGSEMCIRDSSRAGQLRRSRSVLLYAVLVSVTHTNHPQSYLPVSYTHLTLPTICSV
eukprot:10654765-Prorocentrum_lima.AAC.1